MQKALFVVVDPTNRQTSFLGLGKLKLRDVLGFALDMVGLKDAWERNNGDAAAALTEAAGKANQAVLDAKIRAAGYDPERFYMELASKWGTSVENLTADQINQGLAEAQDASRDPSHQLWLIAGLGLLVVLGLTGGTKRGRGAVRRGYSRFKSYRSSRKARRFARRGR